MRYFCLFAFALMLAVGLLFLSVRNTKAPPTASLVEEKQKILPEVREAELLSELIGETGTQTFIKTSALAREQAFLQYQHAAAQGTQSGNADVAFEEKEFYFDPASGTANNPAQGMSARLSPSGALEVFSHDDNSWHWSMETVDLGKGKISQIEGNRSEFDRGKGVSEWFVNSVQGVEQGFTIEAPGLVPRVGQEERIEVAFDSDLQAEIRYEKGMGDVVSFRDEDGFVHLHYHSLKVYDADGNTLPSRLEKTGDQKIAMVYRAEGAAYPITVDPIVSREIGRFRGARGSSPEDLVAVGERLFFQCSVEGIGKEWWVTDGTPEGTRLAFDFRPGKTGIISSYYAALGDCLVFSAFDPVIGTELWKSDGTQEGTVLIKELAEGRDGGNPRDFYPLDDRLLFSARDSSGDEELWITDGTGGGTVRVKDINPTGSSQLLGFADVNGIVYFRANDGTHGSELWRTDGTEDGTWMVKDIRTSGSSSPDRIHAAGSGFFFIATEDSTGRELWFSDGTEGGTNRVIDMNPGVGSSYYGDAAVLNGALYFNGSDVGGQELWRSDGTGAGTWRVKDIYPGTIGSGPRLLIESEGRLFFWAADSVHSQELWVTDGTEMGTRLVKDISEGTLNANTYEAVVFDGGIAFDAQDADFVKRVWRSDGTEAGTYPIHIAVPGVAPSPNPDQLTIVGDKLFYVEGLFQNSGEELWVTDGTDGGTRLLDIATLDDQNSTFIEHNSEGFFSATTGAHGRELWKTDGTVEGTQLVKDISPGPISSSPQALVKLNDQVFFVADDNIHGREFWSTDGTPAGTNLFIDLFPGEESGASGSPSFSFRDRLYFQGRVEQEDWELWSTDGTGAGTSMLKDINDEPDGNGATQGAYPSHFVAAGNYLFFLARTFSEGFELWRTDGTAGETIPLGDIYPGLAGGPSFNLVPAGDLVFFEARNSRFNNELWVSDGSPRGTKVTKEIGEGTNGSLPQDITSLGDRVVFQATSGSPRDTELWISDGTRGGTQLLKNINPFGSSFPREMIEFGGEVYFFADNGSTQFDLWKTDGTEEGTILIKMIHVSALSSSQTVISKAVGESLYFSFDNGLTGAELWKTDGTSEGTILVEDLVEGPIGSTPSALGIVNGYFLNFAAVPVEGWQLRSTFVGREDVGDDRETPDLSGTYRPDLLIGNSSRALHGNNRYYRKKAGGKQIAREWASLTQSTIVKIWIKIENDGIAHDRIRVREKGKSARGSRTKVTAIQSGKRKNVSARFKRGAYRADLAPGESARLCYRVRFPFGFSRYFTGGTMTQKTRFAAQSSADRSKRDHGELRTSFR